MMTPQFRTTLNIMLIITLGLVLAGLHQLALAEEPSGGDSMNSQRNETTQPDPSAGARARVSAHASASASSSSSSSGQRDGECRASSTSSAMAQSGDERVTDHDEDHQVSRDGDCSASARSSARVNSP